MPDNIFLGFGSNIGDKKGNIEKAYSELKRAGIKFIKTSRFYQTKPYGVEKQPEFLNSVAQISTELGPFRLLELVKLIEKKIGREKTFRWGPRIIDIDILFYGDIIIKSKILNIPHIDVCNRCFVLVPMCEIACDFTHPEKKISIKKILTNLDCKEKVKPIYNIPHNLHKLI